MTFKTWVGVKCASEFGHGEGVRRAWGRGEGGVRRTCVGRRVS